MTTMVDSLTFSMTLAASPATGLLMSVLASMVFGGAVFVLVRTVINTLYSENLQQDEEWRYDVSRINELRRVSLMYRVFQPIIQGLARINQRAFAETLPEIRREIHAAGLTRYWTAPEYLGLLELQALFLLPLFLYFGINIMGPSGIIIAMAMLVLAGWLLRRNLTVRAEYRLFVIKRRLPFLLDLLTLLMEAGSTFLQALTEAVAEFQDHPVGIEFGRVLGEMSMGKNRTAALESLRERLSDDEITSIVGSIIQGEELGTPLATLFRTQADVLRIKRTQRAETIAGQAGVKMLLPAILVMAATVLIILGPFVLRFVDFDVMS